MEVEGIWSVQWGFTQSTGMELSPNNWLIKAYFMIIHVFALTISSDFQM